MPPQFPRNLAVFIVFCLFCSLGLIGSPQLFAQTVRQQRVGRFHVEVRLLETPARQSVDSGIVVDTARPVDSAALDLEVVFKGTFFDQLLRSK